MRLVILGDPVDHSLSPVLHSAAFAASALIGTYERRRVDAAGMAQAIDEIRSGTLDGANVTMPHKELAASSSDRVAAAAARAGAVNTLVRVGSNVVGHNTDIAGIVAAWEEAELPDNRPVLVLGAGGAAAAALLAIEGRQVAITARRGAAAEAVADRVGTAAKTIPWGTPIADAVVVNATPIGMNNELLPDAVLAGASGLFDMTYGPTPSPSVTLLRAQGMPVVDGRRMLLHQATAAFELWTGHRAPIEAMSAAMGE